MKVDETKKEAEIKYLSINRPNDSVKFEKIMAYINDPKIDVTDMGSVEDINEVDLLNNLRNRFFNKIIYTNVGPTLIIMNPYQKIDGAAGDDIIEKYLEYHKRVNVDDRKEIENPHLYDLTLIAIKHLYATRRNQAIVISGESGAGKTETAKIAMKCITYYFGKFDTSKKDSGDTISLEDQILGCNPILEAFGNAKTVRNDNSSRFGKYVTINLDVVTGKIEGAQMQTYLLEKSRVCEPSEGERNYHIFYHILKGADDNLLKELYLVRDPNAYKYLSVSKCWEVDKINDLVLYKETLDAFKVTGFTDAEVKTIWKMMAAVLLLGNLNFKEVSEASTVEDKPLLEKICSLLSCNYDLLLLALTENVKVIQGQTIKKPLKVAESISYRNVIAKELYNRVFNWLVRKLNKQLAPSIDMNDPNKKYIGLLDIFGFECFENNSVEQMCINFTNEKLQQLYINDVFKAEQVEFVREGLKDAIADIEFKDNQAVIDLMDKKGQGLFQILDDCSLQNKDDTYFFNTIAKLHANTQPFKVGKLVKNKYAIIHTAKDVEYNVNGFVAKNLDEVKQTMKDGINSSTDTIIKYIFMTVIDEKEYQAELQIMEEEKKGKSSSNQASKYLGGKFRNEMLGLMSELSGCECHYVRCLKPNEIKKKEFLVPSFLFQQIRYLGILDTIRVRKDGFPSRKKFRDFFFRFEDVCWFEGKKSVFDYMKIEDDNVFKDLAVKCLKYMTPNMTSKECVIGLTKVFMKSPFYSALERSRNEKIKKKEDASDVIKKIWKGEKVRKKWFAIRKKANYLQVFYRTEKFYIRTKKLRAAARKIQATFRGLIVNRSVKLQLILIYKLQNFIRGFLAKRKVKKMKKHIRFLVKEIRKFLINARKARYYKIKKLVNSIFEKSWNIILLKYKHFAAIKIQALVRGFLTKIHHWSKVLRGRLKKENFLKDKAALLIQRICRGGQVRQLIRMKHIFAFRIQGHWKMNKYSALIREMRARTLIIQRNVRTYLARKHVIDRRMNEYFVEEKQGLDKLLFDTTKSLFPSIIKANDEEVSDFFQDKSTHHRLKVSEIAKQHFNIVLPEAEPYGDPKVFIFAKIADFDIIIDSNEIYDSIWVKEYEKIFNSNIAINSPIQIIGTGSCHTLAVNSKGKVYSWGWNNYGQCGQPFYTTYTEMIIPDLRRDRKGNIPNIPVVNYLSAGKPIHIEEMGNTKQIVCGEDHTFIIDDNGNAFAFGNNNKGQLGLGNVWEVENPKLITDLKGKVKEIKTSGETNYAITYDNELYIWPYLNLKQNYKPLRLFMDKKITILTISCGKNFAIILSKQGVLYSFGKNNKKGELGLGDNKPRSIPEPIYELADNGEKITQVSCGFKHVIAKSSNGKVFSWGNNSDGQLGIGNYQDLNTPCQVQFDHLYTTRINLSQVSAGFRSSYFLTENRQIICCGSNGSFSKSKFPIKFDLNTRTPEISDDSSFAVLRILNTWNTSFSIFYCTFGDVRVLSNKLKSKVKVNSILNTLTSKWESDSSLDAPYIEPISLYFYSSFMKKSNQEKKVNVPVMKTTLKK